jgi:hypothetical protein
MAIKRIAYFAQTGQISSTTGTAWTYVLPVNSASIEVTRPIEAVTAFGQFGALNQAQTNITTCKMSLKGYMGSGTNVTGITASVLNNIIGHTASGVMSIIVQPQGFTGSGILTNLGLDISVGGFGMFDMGFAGVGNPIVADAQTEQVASNQTTLSIAPVTTMSIGSGGLLANANASSIKFSYDLPTDTLTSLGENPNAWQGALNSIIATKAPYKASISVEGFGVNPTITDAQATGLVSIGNIGISLSKGKVTSRSVSNAAGQATANFSYTAEDVSANITDVALGSYTQNNNQLTSPTWGA